MTDRISVCLAGATGWAGSELARAIAGSSDLALSAPISRGHAGRNLGDVLGDLNQLNGGISHGLAPLEVALRK